MSRIITSQFCVTSVTDGENALSLALDNEHEDFLYDDAGVLISPAAGAVSTIHLYDGNGDEPSFTPYIAELSGVDAGNSGAYVANEGGVWKLHVKSIRSDSTAASVLVAAYHKNSYYYAKFTANKVKQDKYDIVVTPNAIAFNPSTYTTQIITVGGTRTDLQGNKTTLAFGTGATNISNVSGSGTIRLHVIYKDANGVSRNEQMTSGSFSVTAGIADRNNGIYFELRKYTGQNYAVCDYETVEIAKVESSIRIDLTNEADMIACDSNGSVRFTRVITTTAKIYDGATAATSGVSVPSGYTKANYALAGKEPASIAISSGVLTLQWTFDAGDSISSSPSYTLNIPLVYKSVTYTATFTLARTDASAIYQVLPDPSAVSFSLNSSNELAPSSVSLKFFYTKETGSGSSSTQVTTGSIIDSFVYPYYKVKKSGSWSSWTKWAAAISGSGITWRNGVADIPNSTEITDIELGLSTASSSPSDSTFVDMEVVPVVKDGFNGDDAVIYTIECSNTIKPGDTSLDVSVKRSEGNSSEVMIYSSAMGAWGVSLTASMTGGGTPAVAVNGVTFSGSITAYSVLTLTLYIGSIVVDTKTVRSVANGAPGTPGHAGRWYYYDGPWEQKQYTMNETQAPYVMRHCTINNVENDYFFMLDFGTSGQSTGTTNLDPASNYNPTSGSGTKPWTLMASEHQYYIAKAFFGDYAQFGSFIINGDWMISKHGQLYGHSGVPHLIDDENSYPPFTVDNAYKKFNEEYPISSEAVITGESVYNFCPNYAVDGKTGRTYSPMLRITTESYDHVGYVDQATGNYYPNILSTYSCVHFVSLPSGYRAKIVLPEISESALGSEITIVNSCGSSITFLASSNIYSGTAASDYYQRAALVLYNDSFIKLKALKLNFGNNDDKNEYICLDGGSFKRNGNHWPERMDDHSDL